MKLYLVCGKARHGKDTTANFIKEYYEKNGKKVCIMHIGNYIKHFAKDYFGWDGKEETKPRELLQQLGTNIIREQMNRPYFFTNRLLEDMEVLAHFYDICVVADVRLPLEIEEVKKQHQDVVVIRVYRPNFENELTEKQRNHVTETALDHYDGYDSQLENTTLEQLQRQVEELIRKEEVK